MGMIAVARPCSECGPVEVAPDQFLVLHLCVLCFGLLQDRNGRISVFPEREEILVGSTGLGGVTLYGVSARQSQARQRSPREVCHQSPVVDKLLKFRSRCVAVLQHKISFSPQIDWA